MLGTAASKQGGGNDWSEHSVDWSGGGSGWSSGVNSGGGNEWSGGGNNWSGGNDWSRGGNDDTFCDLAQKAVVAQSGPAPSTKFEEMQIATISEHWSVQFEMVHPPPIGGAANIEKLDKCVQNGRHSRSFNMWATIEDLEGQFLSMRDTDCKPYVQWFGKLSSMNAPVSNAITPGTRRLSKKRQVYALDERMNAVLGVGRFLVSFSPGFNKQYSYMSHVCPLCHAKLHFELPYFGVDGNFDPALVAAINRHIVHFFWENKAAALKDGVYPGVEGSMDQCTAEKCHKGTKHNF